MNAADAATGPVVLGFDGGWRMADLLRVAAEEAAHRMVPLAIVMVSRPAFDAALGVNGRRSAERRTEATAQRHLIQAAQSVRALHRRLPVSVHHLTEEEARAAAHPLCSAQLLVVGTIGPHGRPAFSLDSVSSILLKAVRCPVFVVPHDVPNESGARRHRTVIAGVGEDSSDAAVIQAGWAESRRRGCDLELFRAFHDRQEEPPGQGLRRAADVVARAVAAADVALDERSSVVLGHDDPAAALIRQARDAELLVIGSRPGALPGLARGSAGPGLIGSLRCPLLVIPGPVPDPWSRPSVAQVGGRAEPAIRR